MKPQNIEKPMPALLWFHGGGFVVGDAEGELRDLVQISQVLGVVVVSVDYRLAPEHPYPAAVEDGYAALRWICEDPVDLNIDPARVAVGGLSAGGCLAAAMTLMSRDLSGPPICFQVLDSPVIDDRLQTPSMREFTDTPNWSRTNAEISWNAYLGSDRNGGAPPFAAPAREPDLRGLPPAYVTACEFDPLRDEAIEYAQRLVQAGVPVELHMYPGTFHGSAAAVAEARVSRLMQEDLRIALRRAFDAANTMPISKDDHGRII
ncbi:alpha/beta hydrolase [Nocardia sp. NPDC060220]|uniref:alpha/beta hydrolase n=1 Tax=Nocardia sp. NPDC060220 TaxID=3347076 RepID=UPI003669C7D2